jgi:hypothetical protein
MLLFTSGWVLLQRSVLQFKQPSLLYDVCGIHRSVRYKPTFFIIIGVFDPDPHRYAKDLLPGTGSSYGQIRSESQKPKLFFKQITTKIDTEDMAQLV